MTLILRAAAASRRRKRRTLVSIAVTPANPSISMVSTQQFTATGTYSDGSHADLTGTVTWTSGTPAAATIAAGGLATGVLVGSSVITATLGAISGNTTLTLTGITALLPDGRGVWESDLGIQTVSGNVSQLSDQKNSNHLTQSTAGLRPPYINNGTGPNGRPYLQGSTSGKYLYSAHSSTLEPTSFTVFCVARATNLPAAFRQLFQYTDPAGTWSKGYGMGDMGVSGALDAWVKAYTSKVRATPSTSAWHVFEMVYGGGVLELLIDGISIGTQSITAPTYSGSDILVVMAGTAGAGPVFGYYWDGDFALLAIDGTAMSSGARSTARAYCGTKYGITVV